MKKQRETKTTKVQLAPKSTLRRDILRDKQLYLMLLPFLLWYILFYYVPFYGIQIAFRDYKPFVGIWESEWVGLKHFINFFQSPYIGRLVRNTFLISFFSMLFTFPASVILAILFDELRSKKFKTAAQTISYLPHFISTVVVAGLVVTFLAPTAGIINVFIEKLGFERIYFMTKPEYFRSIYVIMTGWQGIGFGTIIYSSALAGIDGSLYEAAEIDGAGRFKKILNITLPSIMPTVAIMLIIRMGSLLSVGSDAIILLYQPITYETADVISTFVYRNGLVDSNYSYAAAVGLFNGVIALLLVLVSNTISKKVSDNSLW
ncbi:MAG: sugar ABC transporter permease [Ruminococcaceae bacterium]|nr:sugar ABC transporter permease [Oscillospiraceae bacterium]